MQKGNFTFMPIFLTAAAEGAVPCYSVQGAKPLFSSSRTSESMTYSSSDSMWTSSRWPLAHAMASYLDRWSSLSGKTRCDRYVARHCMVRSSRFIVFHFFFRLAFLSVSFITVSLLEWCLVADNHFVYQVFVAHPRSAFALILPDCRASLYVF